MNRNEQGQPVLYLGDGAYVTFTGYDYLLTANDHDPHRATDRVTLEPGAIALLTTFAAACEAEPPKADEGGEST
jgi:hypothetical protein